MNILNILFISLVKIKYEISRNNRNNPMKFEAKVTRSTRRVKSLSAARVLKVRRHAHVGRVITLGRVRNMDRDDR